MGRGAARFRPFEERRPSTRGARGTRVRVHTPRCRPGKRRPLAGGKGRPKTCAARLPSKCAQPLPAYFGRRRPASPTGLCALANRAPRSRPRRRRRPRPPRVPGVLGPASLAWSAPGAPSTHSRWASGRALKVPREPPRRRADGPEPRPDVPPVPLRRRQPAVRPLGHSALGPLPALKTAVGCVEA